MQLIAARSLPTGMAEAVAEISIQSQEGTKGSDKTGWKGHRSRHSSNVRHTSSWPELAVSIIWRFP